MQKSYKKFNHKLNPARKLVCSDNLSSHINCYFFWNILQTTKYKHCKYMSKSWFFILKLLAVLLCSSGQCKNQAIVGSLANTK